MIFIVHCQTQGNIFGNFEFVLFNVIFFVLFCTFLYCLFFVLFEKIGYHAYKKVQKHDPPILSKMFDMSVYLVMIKR